MTCTTFGYPLPRAGLLPPGVPVCRALQPGCAVDVCRQTGWTATRRPAV